MTKRADAGKLLCIKKRVLMELLFLSKQNLAHCIFCDLNKCSRVYWDLTQIEARHEEQEPRGQRQFSETEMEAIVLRDLCGLICSVVTAAPNIAWAQPPSHETRGRWGKLS